MNAAYKLTVNDITDLLRVASPWHRRQVARLVKATIRKAGESFRCSDESGANISISEIHRRSQADPKVQRSIYNIWCFYMR